MIDNEKIIKNVKSTMACENFILDDSDLVLINEFLNNKITEQEGIDKIKSEFLNMN